MVSKPSVPAGRPPATERNTVGKGPPRATVARRFSPILHDSPPTPAPDRNPVPTLSYVERSQGAAQPALVAGWPGVV